MNDFDVSYMDIQGDGILGIWHGYTSRYAAFCAGITVKTFVHHWFRDWVKQKTDDKVQVDVHEGMDQHHVFVKRIGMRGAWRQKEVWAGQPVNVAVKMCDLAGPNEMVVSERLYKSFRTSHIYRACPCPSEPKNPKGYGPLWTEEEISDERFPFDAVWRLTTNWCKKHGNEWCGKIMDLAKD